MDAIKTVQAKFEAVAQSLDGVILLRFGNDEANRRNSVSEVYKDADAFKTFLIRKIHQPCITVTLAPRRCGATTTCGPVNPFHIINVPAADISNPIPMTFPFGSHSIPENGSV